MEQQLEDLHYRFQNYKQKVENCVFQLQTFVKTIRVYLGENDGNLPTNEQIIMIAGTITCS